MGFIKIYYHCLFSFFLKQVGLRKFYSMCTMQKVLNPLEQGLEMDVKPLCGCQELNPVSLREGKLLLMTDPTPILTFLFEMSHWKGLLSPYMQPSQRCQRLQLDGGWRAALPSMSLSFSPTLSCLRITSVCHHALLVSVEKSVGGSFLGSIWWLGLNLHGTSPTWYSPYCS